MQSMGKSLVAEFIGTFALILLGAGAGTLAGAGIAGSLVTVALAHGLTIMIFAYAFGEVSGSLINPAVTVGLWVGGAMEAKRVIPYMVVQIAGVVVAGFILIWVFGEQGGSLGATVVNYETGMSIPTAFVLELIGTFFLVNTIMNTEIAGKASNAAPFAIGMTVAACIMMFGPLTRASLNPAGTLGPVVAAGVYADIWLFLVATTLGAALAGALNRFFMIPGGE